MRKISRLWVLALLAFLVIPIANASAQYKVSYFIEYDVVYSEVSAKFDGPVEMNIVYELPYDARGVFAYVDGEEIDVELDGVNAIIPMQNNTVFKLEYISSSMALGHELVTTIPYPFDADKTMVRVTLPSGSTIERPLSSTLAPKPKDLFTDGSNIGIVWVFQKNRKGDEENIMVKYEEPSSFDWFLFIAIAGLILVAIFSTILYMKKSKFKPEKQDDKKQEKADSKKMDYDHLKEDESQIVEILKMKKGSCEQGTLRIITGFSKAKLSGLLKEMQERKVVYKEKRGKKNLVFLKKQ